MSKCAILDSLEFANNKTKEGRNEGSKEGDEDEDGDLRPPFGPSIQRFETSQVTHSGPQDTSFELPNQRRSRLGGGGGGNKPKKKRKKESKSLVLVRLYKGFEKKGVCNWASLHRVKKNPKVAPRKP